jgi:hypothetical protein
VRKVQRVAVAIFWTIENEAGFDFRTKRCSATVGLLTQIFLIRYFSVQASTAIRIACT